jgi:hypothetical protein
VLLPTNGSRVSTDTMVQILLQGDNFDSQPLVLRVAAMDSLAVDFLLYPRLEADQRLG